MDDKTLLELKRLEARAFLMSGPRATPPRPSTVRRMMRVIDADGPRDRGAVVPAGTMSGWIHPTKGLRA